MNQQSQARGNILIFSIIILIIIGGFYFGYKKLGGKKEAPVVQQKENVQPTIEPEQASLAKGIYVKGYNTTFFYSGNKITVNSVRVSGLNKKKAKVVYNMSIIEPSASSKYNISWVLKNYFVLSRVNSKYPASYLRIKKVGNNKTVSVVFKVSPKFLKSTSYLTIKYYSDYTIGKIKKVSLGLTVPKLDTTIITPVITPGSTSATSATGSTSSTGSTGVSN